METEEKENKSFNFTSAGITHLHWLHIHNHQLLEYVDMGNWPCLNLAVTAETGNCSSACISLLGSWVLCLTGTV